MANRFVAVFFALCLLMVDTMALAAGTIGTTSVSPNATPAGVPLVVTITSSITDPSLIPESVNLQKLDASGRVIAVIGTLHDDGLNGDATAGDKIFSITTTVLENATGTVKYRVSAGFLGSLLRVNSAAVTVTITGTATGISIQSPANAAYINTPVITISGTVGDPAAQVNVNGIAAPVSNKVFVTTVPLNEGPNTLTAVAANSNGTTSTASILVTLDTTPPHLNIYTPTNNGVTTDASVTVTGLVNDIVVGTVNPTQATVTVNGVAAQVVNRSFLANNVPLAMGSNTIRAVTADRAGNSATATVIVTRQAQAQATLKLQSGNTQAGTIKTDLPSPLVAKLTNAGGAPIANTPVVFRVTNQDGTVSTTGTAGSGLSSVAVNTDVQGLASVFFTLGSRAGVGNNVVEASTLGVPTTATFVASANAATAGLIVVDSGNNQNGVIGQVLPLPFIAIVTDSGNNRLPGVKVTFSVKNGSGNIAGKSTFVATTDSDGRAMANLTLGPNPGVNNNLVEVGFTGNLGYPAAFTATAMIPGPADQTRISGVVLDNSNNPIPGITMRLYQINQGTRSNLPTEVAQSVQTNAQGQFLMQPVPVGVFKLMADGTTAQRSGYWPTLEYDMITVPGQDNTVGMPIYLPELLTQNRLCVNESTGGTLTIPQAPGFALTIAPGSATFPGGSRSGCVSVTPVNMDKVPMAPGFGQQPRFIVTIQPVGTIFNPPAALTIPNVDGLAPRAVTEMYSFDHDLASFVAIGSGTVSEDGSVISSDPGVGVLKAGWHCGGNPNTSGSAGTCATCQKCQGSQCVADNSGTPAQNSPTDCKKEVCQGGAVSSIANNSENPNQVCKRCLSGLVAPEVDGASCDDNKFCTSADGLNLGLDRCNGGSCTGKPLTFPKDFTGNVQYDFTKLRELLNGATLAAKFVPGCTVGGPPAITGALGIGRTKSCCENERRIADATELSGSVGVRLPAVQCRLPVFSYGLATLTANLGVEGNGTVTGSGVDDDCASTCGWRVDGQIAATLSGGIGVNVISPDVIEVAGGIRGGGNLTVSGACRDISVSGCIGPPNVFGTVTLGGFYSKEVSTDVFDSLVACF